MYIYRVSNVYVSYIYRDILRIYGCKGTAFFGHMQEKNAFLCKNR